MNATTYFKLVWKTNRTFLLFSMITLAAMQLLILNLVAGFDTKAIINSIFEQLPENMRIFLQDSFFSTLTLDGAAAFGYNHPMIIALVTVNAITLPVRHISREIESGTMELMLSHPLKREKFILMLWFSGAVLLMAVTASAFIGSLGGIYFFHHLSGKIIGNVAAISLLMWLYMMFVFSLTMMIATLKKGGSAPGNYAAMIVFVFYLLFLVGQLWDKLRFLLPYNIFNYYEPQKVMLHQGHLSKDVLVLLLLTLLSLGFSLHFFRRRDIP